MKKRFALFAASLAFVLLALPVLAFADGAPELQDSDPADGAVIEAGGPYEFVLHFSNNVAESTVASGNIDKIHIEFAGDGEYEVSYGVRVVDPNEDRDKRQYIYIDVDTITPGAWQIVIDPGITAKNGSSAEQGWTINFTVAGDAPSGGGSGSAGGFPTWAWIAIGAVVVAAVVAIVLLKRKPKAE